MEQPDKKRGLFEPNSFHVTVIVFGFSSQIQPTLPNTTHLL